MRKRALNTVVSLVLLVVGLVSVGVATLVKKTKKNTKWGDAYAKQMGMEAVLFK